MEARPSSSSVQGVASLVLALAVSLTAGHADVGHANCNGEWKQCGGGSWAGPTCCVSGHWCKKIDPMWYHQCVPGVNPSPPATTTTKAPTLAPTVAPTVPPPTLAPTSAPTFAPPTPAPAPLTCAALCSRTVIGACGTASTDKTICEQKYMVKIGRGVPCVWKACGCFANGENLLQCPCVPAPAPEPESELEEEEEPEPEREEEEEEPEPEREEEEEPEPEREEEEEPESEREEEEEPEPESEREEEEEEPRPESTPEPMPEPTPVPSPEPTPEPSPCALMCAKTNLRDEGVWCSKYNNNEAKCLQSYLQAPSYQGGKSVPCRYTEKGKCKAWKDAKVQCSSYSCPESFLQVEDDSPARSIRKHSFLSRALLQVDQCLGSETALHEDVDRENTAAEEHLDSSQVGL